MVHDIGSLLLHAGRPELVATGLLSVLEQIGCTVGARAISRAPDKSVDVLASFGTLDDDTSVRTFAVGTARDRQVELQVQPLSDVESHAAVNSVGFLVTASQHIERARLEREERLTLWPIDELPAEDDDSLVTGKMRDVMLTVRKIAESRATVLISGESGTGKEVVARALHRYSPRARRPFVPFNCTAVPRELIESHLFGFRRGAFTGADRDNPGLIRAAKDGTLFLDEVGDLSLELQPKLLRFLELGEVNPLGEATPVSVNVRVVAATNANLRKLVEQGRFREDLYYRLNVFPVELPPLRERRDEIQALARYFILKWGHELGKGRLRLSQDLIAHLELYSWPGNIRQLSHEINRMVITADANQELTPACLPKPLREEAESAKRRVDGLEVTVNLDRPMEQVVDDIERRMIERALAQCGGKMEAAAKALGISRKGLYLKRQRLGL
ncbi:MAG: sigma-54 dependent transcriptional regulator [Vicinamibacterales bacterium]